MMSRLIKNRMLFGNVPYSWDGLFRPSLLQKRFNAKSCTGVCQAELNAIHPERMSEISRWSPPGAAPVTEREPNHPEGMTETTILAPISGGYRRIRREPVVALR